MQDEVEVKAQEWLESTARLAGSHGVSFDQESMMRIGFENGYLAALRQRPVVDSDAYCDNVLDPLWRDYGEDSVQYQTALKAYRQMRQRPCRVCGERVDTCENGTPGAELFGGGWVCSEACWDRAADDADRPVVDDARMARALEWLRAECGFYSNPEARTHLPAIEEAIAAYRGQTAQK